MALDTNLYTYDPKLFVMTFGALVLMDWEQLDAEPAEMESFKLQRGPSGFVQRQNMNVNDIMVRLRLPQGSPFNLALSSIHQVDKRTNGGIFQLAIKDIGTGTSAVFARQAFIATPAKLELQRDFTPREWIFKTGPATLLVGGL